MNRGVFGQCAQLLSGHDREVMLNFRDILYHISGARVVHCESNLPPANYIDFSHKDMANGKVSLDKVSVFWKVFMEVVFESLNCPYLPVEMLDLLTFEDFYNICQPLHNRVF